MSRAEQYTCRSCGARSGPGFAAGWTMTPIGDYCPRCEDRMWEDLGQAPESPESPATGGGPKPKSKGKT